MKDIEVPIEHFKNTGDPEIDAIIAKANAVADELREALGLGKLRND